MEINKKIRHQVVDDLSSALIGDDGVTLVAAYFAGKGEPVTASDDGVSGFLEVPAIAVYLSDGDIADSDFDLDTFSSVLSVEIMDLATNQLDDDLDDLGERVLAVINRNYTANGLLTNCYRSGFQYVREDGAPWGSLILTFNVEMEIEP